MNGLTMGTRLTMLAAKARTFLRAKRGNVAAIFAVSLFPITVAAGAGVDYTRALLVHQYERDARRSVAGTRQRDRWPGVLRHRASLKRPDGGSSGVIG